MSAEYFQYITEFLRPLNTAFVFWPTANVQLPA